MILSVPVVQELTMRITLALDDELLVKAQARYARHSRR
jgi:hypothetical protein